MAAEPYHVRLTRRMRIAGKLYRAGEGVLVAASRLRVAAIWCRQGVAQPADERSRLAIDLCIALDDAEARQMAAGAPIGEPLGPG